jgi:ABC-type polysaccharide/polyol phosphate transport system ATPase subunit
MSKREIERKFDEIVAFAGTGQFLDTPVKHYSSGMTVRLAFAVATHLEPEILIIDEVLGVGDIASNKRCFGRWATDLNASKDLTRQTNWRRATSSISEVKICRRWTLNSQGQGDKGRFPSLKGLTRATRERAKVGIFG